MDIGVFHRTHHKKFVYYYETKSLEFIIGLDPICPPFIVSTENFKTSGSFSKGEGTGSRLINTLHSQFVYF